MLNLQGNINLLTANVLRRLLSQDDQDKALITQIENLLALVQNNNVSLDFNAMSSNVHTAKLGDNFTLLLGFDRIVHILQEASQIEYFVSL